MCSHFASVNVISNFHKFHITSQNTCHNHRLEALETDSGFRTEEGSPKEDSPSSNVYPSFCISFLIPSVFPFVFPSVFLSDTGRHRENDKKGAGESCWTK